MGDLIRINKGKNVSLNKPRKLDIKKKNVEGQLFMFTGIRYERQTEKNTNDVRHDKKHKNG